MPCIFNRSNILRSDHVSPFSCKKEETFLFKVLFVSRRYDASFPRYDRLKRSIFLNISPPLSSSHGRSSRSHIATDLSEARPPRVDQWQTLTQRYFYYYYATYAFPRKKLGHGDSRAIHDRLERCVLHSIIRSFISLRLIEISTWNKLYF